MVISKDTTYGLESKILQLQSILNINLPWFNLVDNEAIEIYGLIERNKKKIDNQIRIIPESYSSVRQNYKNPFINNKISATIGFQEMDIDPILLRATVKVIFTVKLDEIHGNQYRDRHRAMLEAKRILNDSGICEVTEYEHGIDDVFSGFYTEDITYRDMQPWFVFSYTIETTYNDNLCSGLDSIETSPNPSAQGYEVENSGSFFASAGIINVTYPNTMLSDTHQLLIQVFDTTGKRVGYTLESQTKEGFSINLTFDGTINYIAKTIS